MAPRPAKPPGSAPGKAPLTPLNDLGAKPQDKLGALISVPPLTTSLLRRPPFRFIHDVVSAVTLTTGFAKWIFDGDEKVASKLCTQGEKTQYMSKIINHRSEEHTYEL